MGTSRKDRDAVGGKNEILSAHLAAPPSAGPQQRPSDRRRPEVSTEDCIEGRSRWCDDIGSEARVVLESEGARFFLLWLERRQAEGWVHP